MTRLPEHIITYLDAVKLMQLASVRDNKPWLCNVWYVMDEDSNVYWTSRECRRHSQELTDNPFAACTFHQHFDGGLAVDKGQALIMSGEVTHLSGETVGPIYDLYAARYPQALTIQSREISIDGSGVHHFYRLTPSEIVWWDEVNHADQPRQVIL